MNNTANRIVVGVDGSKPSRMALRWAASLAKSMGCTIEAVSVWQIPVGLASAGWTTAAIVWNPEEDTERLLHQTLREVLGDEAAGQVKPLVCEGGAADVLLRESKDAHMLVVGSRGHGGFTGLLLGSVSTACAEHATCPVLVVHGDTPPPVEPSADGAPGGQSS